MEGSIAQRAARLRRAWVGPAAARAERLFRGKLFLYAIGPALLALIAGSYLLLNAGYVATDDATVSAARVAVSPEVRGRIVEVNVHDNQLVHAGDVLVRLDDTNYRTAVARAQAELASARLQIEASHAQYGFAQSEYARQQRLFAAGVASRRDVQEAANAATVAARQAGLMNGKLLSVSQHPLVLQAQTALTQAQTDLDRTILRAPQDGVVAHVDQIQIGSYTQPAQALFWLISGQPWIDAAFKEDQLERIRAGQPVRVHIDAYPHQTFRGRVVSLSPGTGSSFSVLPTQNASGNWVKVVQRVNVRIALEDAPPDVRLAVGLSASARVDTRETPAALRGRES